jgi:hypothetical protein
MVTRLAAAMMLATLGAAATGCIIVPIPRSTKHEGIRADLSPQQLDFIEPGVTSRREVLFRLGEPDETCRGTWSTLSYVASASRTDVHWAVGVPLPPRGVGVEGTVHEGSRTYLLIRVDPSGRVLRHRFRKVSYRLKGTVEEGHKSVAQLVAEWESSEPENSNEPVRPATP